MHGGNQMQMNQQQKRYDALHARYVFAQKKYKYDFIYMSHR